MILTDCYLFEKLAGTKSKTRYDCTLSDRNHPFFETLRNKKGVLFVHLVNADYVKASHQRQTDTKISNSKGHISSVYMPEITLPLAYGDIKGTKDALLFVFSEDHSQMWVFVARGQKHNKKVLFSLLVDGELDEEIEELKKRTLPESEL